MLGILAPTPVAAAFRSAGVTVATDPDLRKAAKVIRDAMSGNANYPVLVVSDAEQGFRVPDALTQALRGRTSPVLVAGEDFTLPATLGEIAGKLGIELAGDHDVLISASGPVEDNEDDWLDDSLFEIDDPEPVAQTPPAPVAPPTQQVPDGWDSEPVAAPVQPPVQPAAPQPEPPAPAQDTPDGWGVEAAPQQPTSPAQPTPLPPSSWSGGGQRPSPTPQPQPQPSPAVAEAPPASSTSWSLSQESGLGDSDIEEVLYRKDEQAQRSYEAPRMGLALFVWAGGGGVGKSSYSRFLAQMGAEAGMRVVLLDGNRGQADQAQYVLRNLRAEFPTIHTFAQTGIIQEAVMTADDINAVRGRSVGEIRFDTVFSPTPEAHDLRIHTAQLYRDAVDALSKLYDLIVIDTQTLDQDSSDLWDGFIRPMMREGAWAVGTSNDDPPKMKNLISLTSDFANRIGVNPGRSLTFVTMTDPRPEDGDTLARKLTPASTFMGIVAYDQDFRSEMGTGLRIPTDNEAVAPVMRGVMKRVTGLSAFNAPVEEEPPSGIRGWFGNRSKRKRRG